MKEESENNFYLKSFIIIMSATLIALLGIHYIQFILILFPVLFIANIIKDGLSEGITNMIVTIIIIAIVESLYAGMFLAITFVPFTIVISHLIKKRESNIKVLGYSSLTFFVSILIIFIIINLLGVDVVKYIESSFKQVIDMQLESIEDIDLSNSEIFSTKQLLKDAYQYLLLIIPSLVLMLSAAISYINYLLASLILKKAEINIVNIPKFAKFSLPNNVVLGTIIMFGLTFVSGQIGFTYYETVFVNIGVLISMGFFIQGLAVVDYLLNKLKVHVLFRIVFYITFILSTSLVSIMTIVGLVDLIFDLRKIRKKTSH